MALQRTHRGEHVQRQHTGPDEDDADRGQAADAEGHDHQQLHDDGEAEQEGQFSRHQHEAVLRVPLHVSVVLRQE